jgi:hypothetical protein
MALRDILTCGARSAAAFAVAAGIATGALAQGYVTDGLVTMYSFDDSSAADTVGSNDGAVMGGGVSFVPGVINDAAAFDATDGYIEIPDLGNWPSVTMECWAMEHAFGGIQGIISTWQWAAGKVHFKFQDTQIQVDKNGGSKVALDGEENRWYHIAYTSDEASGELMLYVDGALIAEGAGGANPENMQERRIGSEHDGRFLDGKVDEVRIYERVLSADEIAQNFAVDGSENSTSVDPGGKMSITWSQLKNATR